VGSRKAIQMITNSSWCAHTHPLFRSLCILKTEELHKLQVACFMYKVNNGLMTSYFSTFSV